MKNIKYVISNNYIYHFIYLTANISANKDHGLSDY